MKTTIELDDEKLESIMKVMAFKTRKEAIDWALTEGERLAMMHYIKANPWSAEVLRESIDPEYDVLARGGRCGRQGTNKWLNFHQAIWVDAAVYIDSLRAGSDIRQELMPYLANGMLYNCGVVRSEVIRGFKNARLKAEMTAFFNIIPEVPTNARLWQQVAELAWKLDRSSGGNRPLTDIIIARCAMQVDAVLISPDEHFQGIPGLNVRPEL